MKKKIILPILTFTLALLVGCGAQKDVEVDNTSPVIESTEDAPTDSSTEEVSLEELASSDIVLPEEPSEIDDVEEILEEEKESDYLTLAKEAEEAGNLTDAYNYYGHAYWEGNSQVQEKINELAMQLPDLDFASILKYTKMCPVAGDDVKTVHIRLEDGTIVENGGSLKASNIEGAVVVFGDEALTEHDYYVASILSVGEYHVAEDPEPNWAYDTIIEKNHEYSLSDTAALLEDTYDNLCITYIDYDVYSQGNYDAAVELNFTLEK